MVDRKGETEKVTEEVEPGMSCERSLSGPSSWVNGRFTEPPNRIEVRTEIGVWGRKISNIFWL